MIDAEESATEPDDIPVDSADDIDPGSPLPELANLTLTASPGFETRVQTRIQRRLIAGNVVQAPAGILASLMQNYVRELAQAVGELGASQRKRPDKPKPPSD